MNSTIKINSKLLLPITISLMFFLRKGIQYAGIGNYWAICLIGLIIYFMLRGLNNRPKLLKKVVRLWSILILLWAGLRILFTGFHFTTDVFDEYHLSMQFGLLGLALSIMMLALGIMILKNVHYLPLRKKDE